VTEPEPTVDTGAVPCTTEQTQLGEGTRWDARRDELLRVDILAGRVYRDRVADDGALVPVRTYDVPGTVGALAPMADDDGWVLAAGQGFVHLAEDGALTPMADVVGPGSRLNDAACDPQGRMWAGSLADDHHEGGGVLYRLERDGRTDVVLDGLTIPNGMGWSTDGTTMYLIDSGPRTITAFAFDPVLGTISDGRVLVAVPGGQGSPDGMTVDATGDLWVAFYDGACVRRYSPAGVLRQVLRVPAAQSTCCAFAGPGLSRLYVTTATELWTEEQRLAAPAAGLVYRFDTEAAGLPAAPYRPSGPWWTERAG
jgi:sugar lactone lactonase YvrE